MASLSRRKYKCPTTGQMKTAKNWYGKYRDENGVTKRVPLSPNKAAAQAMLAEKVRLVERIKAGHVEPSDKFIGVGLGEHLGVYGKSFIEKGHTERQADMVLSICRRTFEACKFRYLNDLSSEKAQGWLASRRGIPRKEGGIGAQTFNHWVAGLKAFGNWCEKTGRVKANPLKGLARVNVQSDIRHKRRDLSEEEFSELIPFVEGSRSSRRTILSGPSRAMLYRLAGMTGLRASECASLTASSFSFDSSPPTVTVEAAYSKHRRMDVVPLHPELCEVLREWVRGRGAGLLWPGKWAEHFGAGKMLRRDLNGARKVWLSKASNPEERILREKSDFLLYRDHSGRVADFHSLRHRFVSELVRSGAHPKDCKELARHSTISLTMDRYAHANLPDLSTAVSRLNLPAGPTTGPTSGQRGICSGESEIVERPEAFTVGFDVNAWDVEGLGVQESRRYVMREVHPEGFEPSTFGSVARCTRQKCLVF